MVYVLVLVGSYHIMDELKFQTTIHMKKMKYVFATFAGAFGHALHIYSPSNAMDRLYVKSGIDF